MSKLEVDKIDPQSGTDLELGSSGDTVTIPTGVTLDASNATTTLPATVVTTTGTQTLTNKTIDASQLTNNTVTSAKINYPLTTFSSTGIDDNASSTAITIDSSQNVGVGTASPVSLGSNITTVEITGGSTIRQGGIYLSNSDKSVKSYIYGSNTATNLGTETNIPLVLLTNNTERMRIDDSGHVTKPSQPAVQAYLNTTQSNIPTGFTTVQLNAEIYDVNSDFNTSTYTFTAPVTGKYLVTMNLVMTDVDTAFQWIYLVGVSSNRNYYLNQIDPRMLASDGTWSWVGSSLVDMDANDTFIMRTRSSAHGAAQMDIAGGTANATETTMTMTLLS